MQNTAVNFFFTLMRNHPSLLSLTNEFISFYLGLGDVLRGLGYGVEAVRGEGHDGPAPGDLEAVVLRDRAVEASLGAALRPGETLQL